MNSSRVMRKVKSSSPWPSGEASPCPEPPPPPSWCVGHVALDRIWRRVSGDLIPAGGMAGMDRVRQSITDLARDTDALALIRRANPDLDLSTGEAVADAVLTAFKRLITARGSVQGGRFAPPFTALSLVNNWSDVQKLLRGEKNPEAEADAERVERRRAGAGGTARAAPAAAAQTATAASSKWGSR